MCATYSLPTSWSIGQANMVDMRWLSCFSFWTVCSKVRRETMPLVWPAIIVMSIWQGVGFQMVLFLAGLQGIPTELEEAARIDGATDWQAMRHVTLPLMTSFDTSTSAMQWVEKAVWIERFNVHYHLGVDGISMWKPCRGWRR